jgi:hypothetical protein
MDNGNGTVARTPNIQRLACLGKHRHEAIDWSLHPYAGHGYTKESGWTHPDLEPR